MSLKHTIGRFICICRVLPNLAFLPNYISLFSVFNSSTLQALPIQDRNSVNGGNSSQCMQYWRIYNDVNVVWHGRLYALLFLIKTSCTMSIMFSITKTIYLKCLTNSNPSESFFQNLRCPSTLAVTTNPPGATSTFVITSRCMKLFSYRSQLGRSVARKHWICLTIYKTLHHYVFQFYIKKIWRW